MADPRAPSGVGGGFYSDGADPSLKCDSPWWKFWGGGCTGYVPGSDAGAQNVQTNMRAASSLADAEQANKALDDMESAMASASVPDNDAAKNALGSLSDAFNAIAVARKAIEFGGPWTAEMGDAAAKSTIYLNQVGAGVNQLNFAKDQFWDDLRKPLANLGIDLSWIAWGALIIVASVFIYKVSK